MLEIEKSIVGELAELELEQVVPLQLDGEIVQEFQMASGLDYKTMIQVLDIAQSTYYKIKKGETLKEAQKWALVSVAQIIKKGVRVFDDNHENFMEFMHTHHHNLGNLKPIDLIVTEGGRKELDKALDRIDYGVFG